MTLGCSYLFRNAVSVLSTSGQVAALQCLGYAKPEAEFLLLATLHSGYFLRRQFEAFISAPRGRPADRFLQRVVGAGHARSVEYANRTEVFHLFARTVYRAIGEEENRNRRPRPNFSIKAKLMSLDFVLANRDRRFLATENEKIQHFCGDLGLDESLLPGKTYSSRRSPGQTRRYFVEKYPIFVAPAEGGDSSPITFFCYVDEGVLSTSGFTSFLNRYRRLFVALRRFRLVYVAAEYRHFRSAQRAFDRFAESLTRPESRLPRGAMGDYFMLRHLFETRQYDKLDKAKLDRLRDLSARFGHPKTEAAFQEWTSEITANERSRPVDAAFEFHLLPHRYDIFSTQKEPGSSA